ncbi:MAG: hypothetical protein WBF93_16410, partial [Pirellulales bacterium]
MPGTVASSLAKTLLGIAPGFIELRVRGSKRDGQIVRLRGAKCGIGSTADCSLQLRAEGVPLLGCTILRGARETIVRSESDLVRLNGLLFAETSLTAGDHLTVGPFEIEVLALNATDARPKATAPVNRQKTQQSARPTRSAADASPAAVRNSTGSASSSSSASPTPSPSPSASLHPGQNPRQPLSDLQEAWRRQKHEWRMNSLQAAGNDPAPNATRPRAESPTAFKHNERDETQAAGEPAVLRREAEVNRLQKKIRQEREELARELEDLNLANQQLHEEQTELAELQERAHAREEEATEKLQRQQEAEQQLATMKAGFHAERKSWEAQRASFAQDVQRHSEQHHLQLATLVEEHARREDELENAQQQLDVAQRQLEQKRHDLDQQWEEWVRQRDSAEQHFAQHECEVQFAQRELDDAREQFRQERADAETRDAQQQQEYADTEAQLAQRASRLETLEAHLADAQKELLG